mmetsp:Transcript_44752/g.95260  ORF Transcript_44752/g.95260 Transcript_44752/m.95260 type:complete len:202 (+) Transcript_44752:501-1106(+)
MPRTIVDDLHFERREGGYDFRDEAPRRGALNLDTKEDDFVCFDVFLHPLLLILRSELRALVDYARPPLFHELGLLDHPLGDVVELGNGEPQREGWDDGRDQHREDDGSVEVGTDETLVLGEDSDDEGKFSLGGHGTPGDQAVPQVQPLKSKRVVEVRHQKAHDKLPRQRQREKQAVGDDHTIPEVLDWDLETDARREEDPH